ncbi:DHHA1 domain-containing protein [candidate division KSB1 bacterium]
MTERLFQDNSYLRSFDSKIIKQTEHEGKPAVVLDKTLFYPVSGGQLHDTGKLNDSVILDVIDNEDGILHVVDKLPGSDNVHGEIDWNTRFDNMQQHTGQHILSASIIRILNAETISSSLGRDISTIDINRTSFSNEDMLKVELDANSWVYKNVTVNILYPDDEEIKNIPLRKQPPPGKKVRIINIEDLDFSPCGGTHCRNTGEVGIIKIKRWEKMRGNIRLEFYCGKRAFTDYYNKSVNISDISGLLQCNENEVFDHLQNQMTDSKNTRREMNDLRNELFGYQARKIFDSGEKISGIKIIQHCLKDTDIQALQNLAQHIRKQGDCVVLLGSSGKKPAFVFTCTEGTDNDLREILNDLRKNFNIKGGGGPSMVQGGLDENTNLEEFLDSAYDETKKVIKT